jgi:hypothetical protein
MGDVDRRVVALEQQLAEFKRSSEASIARLQEQLAIARQATGDSTGPSSGTPAILGNRVEWKITGVKEKIDVMHKGQSIYSEAFDCMGLRGIQLEFYPGGRQTDGTSGYEGFCSVFLWCPPGANIRYFLFCGSYCRAPDEDLFDARMGHGHSNFCFLNDQIQTDDSVTIGVEILEVYTKSTDLTQDVKLVWKSLRETIRAEIEVLNNVGVDRVEWQVRNVSKIRKSWPKGASIFSPLFNAAGVRDILFEFYPNGSAVTAAEGMCGFYIRCPDGTSVTLTLFVGKVRKGPISARFEHATGKGLPDFCELDQQIDPVSDSVTIGIEIRNNDWPPPKTLRI